MPIEEICDNPIMLQLPAAGYGIVMRLLHHFWETDCAPLPTQTRELQSIARAHGPTWRNHYAQIRPLVKALTENMIVWRERRDAAMARLGNAREERHARERAQRLERQAAAPASEAPTRLGAESREKRAARRISALEVNSAEVNKTFSD